MPKQKAITGRKTWTKPKVRRLASGSAELNSSTSVDGSGTFS